jgi:hypothetical protein
MIDKEELKEELYDELPLVIADRYNVDDIDDNVYFDTIRKTVSEFIDGYPLTEDGYIEDYSYFQNELLNEALTNLGID